MFEPKYCGLCNHDYLSTTEGQVIHFISLSSNIYLNKVPGRYKTKRLCHTECFLNNVTFVIRWLLRNPRLGKNILERHSDFLIDLKICPTL